MNPCTLETTLIVERMFGSIKEKNRQGITHLALDVPVGSTGRQSQSAGDQNHATIFRQSTALGVPSINQESNP